MANNYNRSVYMNIPDYLKVNEMFEFITDDILRKCIDNDSIWIMKWYPKNMHSFKIVIATTFEECFELSKEHLPFNLENPYS